SFMETNFVIYIRAVGLYALITLPALFLPLLYVLSLFYAFFFGWFAWALFSLLSWCTVSITAIHHYRMLLLTFAVPASVAFAFQMIEVFDAWDNVWQSGGFLLFPLAATLAGWVSLFISEKKFAPAEELVLTHENNGV
ncbi:MAG: hypothetical protein JNM19_12695, partial [Chitinophagaceae bacterium]|nr:hypothetical protein [Chitinophagaceae bacterium]